MSERMPTNFKSFPYLSRLTKRFVRYKRFIHEQEHWDVPPFYYIKFYEHVVWVRLNKRWDNYLKVINNG